MILDKWQREVLEHKGHFLLCTGRQVGKTTIMSIKAAKYMLEHQNSKIIIISLTEDQAKLIIVMILSYFEKYHRNKIQKGKNKPTQSRIYLKNGSSCIARPVGNTGDAVRGFTGNVLIIDEASRMPELVFTSGKPTLLTTAGEIWICSTPYGKNGYFWEAYQNKNNRYKIFQISSEEVIRNRKTSESWTEKQRKEALDFLENEKKDMSQTQYGQEYLGLFLDDLRQFFPDELIDKVCIRKRNVKIKNGKNYLGVDIARMGNDESTFEIITEINDNYHHQENIVTTKTLTTETERRILNLSQIWKARKVGLDAGAGTLGVSILDHLLETKIRNKVIALNNRAIATDKTEKPKFQRLLKEDMYFNLLSMMESNEIQLLDDENVGLSLKSVQFEFVKTTSSQTKTRIFGNYTHIVEGIIRAAWLAKKEKSLNLWAA